MSNKKIPALNEVFLVSNHNMINVGAAYSLREKGPPPTPSNAPAYTANRVAKLASSSKQPLQGAAEEAVQEYLPRLERISQMQSGREEYFVDLLRQFARAVGAK